MDATQANPVAEAIRADVQSGALTQAEADIHLAKLNPAATTTDSPPVASASPGSDVPLGQAGLPASDAAALAADLEAMRASGKMSPEEYAQALAESGAEPAKSLSAEEIEFNVVHGTPAKTPADYKLPSFAAPNMTEAQAMANMQKVAGWLHAAQLTPEDGSAIAKQVDRVGQRLAKMTDSERVMYGRTELEKIRGLYGKDTPQKFERVRALIDSMPQGKEVIEFVRATNCIDDALVFSLLVTAADKAYARAEMKAKKK